MTSRIIEPCAAAVMVLAFACQAAAQPSRLEVSGGYAPAHVADQTFPRAWSVAVGTNLTRSSSLIVEVNGAYKNERDQELDTEVKLSIHNIAGGPRWSIRMARMVPFVQILAGAARVGARATILDRRLGESTTKFTLQPGGGVDLRVNDRLGIVGQMDYRRLFFDENDVRAGENQLRAIVGVRVSL